MIQVESAPTLPFHDIQLPVRSEFLRNFLRAMATSLTRAKKRPAVLLVPHRDRHELRSGMRFVADELGRCGDPRFVASDSDFCEFVLEETHHTRPVVHLNGDDISMELQERILHEWRHMPFRPPFTIIVVSRDPGELYQEMVWLRGFRELMHMPTYRWPEATTRLKTPERRMSFFAKVFEEIAKKEFPVYSTEQSLIEPGARDLLQQKFFTKFQPAYVGNYVKFAVDLIVTMKKFGEPRLSAKVLLALTDPGHDFSLA